MPPKRRTTTPRTTSATRQQSTLSFNGKASRVTKASQQQQTGKKLDLDAKKKQALYDEASTPDEVPHPDEDDNNTTNDVIEIKSTPPHARTRTAQPKPEPEEEEQDPLNTTSSKTSDVLGGPAQPSDVGAVGGLAGSGWVGDEESRARKTSETQINRFWREKENARLVPRVHQGDLDVHERVLRLWDVSAEYGVSQTVGVFLDLLRRSEVLLDCWAFC